MSVDDITLAKRYIQTHSNAEQRGHDFSLTLVDMRRLMNTKRCYFTAVELTHESDTPNKLTFDRIDNSVGYHKGNVVACSHKANQIKEMLIEDVDGGKHLGVAVLQRMANKLTERLG
jgi:hypothetical protein